MQPGGGDNDVAVERPSDQEERHLMLKEDHFYFQEQKRHNYLKQTYILKWPASILKVKSALYSSEESMV